MMLVSLHYIMSTQVLYCTPGPTTPWIDRTIDVYMPLTVHYVRYIPSNMQVQDVHSTFGRSRIRTKVHQIVYIGDYKCIKQACNTLIAIACSILNLLLISLQHCVQLLEHCSLCHIYCPALFHDLVHMIRTGCRLRGKLTMLSLQSIVYHLFI